jgi:hypothetical protein
MAKQDLVVKLLLDSGAFGNDLRQAERKAKEFGDKIKSAGNSASAFGTEIGLSAGALGKLGGMLTGAGAVVAAVGAFKSVMESSAESSKKFNGAIAGVQGVIGELQTALATFDFTTFMNGMDDVFRRAKEFKENMTDLQFSNIAYGYLSTEHMKGLKEAELKYKNAKTDAEKEAATAAAKTIINTLNEEVNALISDVNNTFISGVLKKDAGKLKDGVSPEQAAEWTKQALRYTLLDYKEDDQQNYKNITKEIAELDMILNNGLSKFYDWGRNTWYGKLVSKELDFLFPSLAPKYDEIDEVLNNRDYYEQYLDDLVKNNQDLFFRNALYKYKPEELSTLINLLTDAANKQKAAAEAELQFKSWSESGGTTVKKQPQQSGGSTETKIEILDDSITDLKKKLSEAEAKVGGQIEGTDKWWEYQAEVEKYIKLLDAALLRKAKLLHPMEPLPKLPDILPKGLTAPEIGLAMPKAEETPVIRDIESIISNVSNLNTVLSSSVMLINGMGDAFANCEDESIQKMAGVVDVLSTVGNAAINLAQIYQTAIATNEAYAASVALGQAAALPFPANIAAIATVVGTLVSVVSQINQIKNAGKYAEGGIVGGTSYSGDKLFAMVNSGEMILNKRQQSNLSNMLGSGRDNSGGGQVEFHISGDTLVGVLNNKRNKTHLTR